MLDVLLPAAGLVLLVVALAIPYKLPRAGAVLGCLAVLGGGLLLHTHNTGYLRHLFDSIDRVVGAAAMIYGVVWVGISTLRSRGRRITAEPA
jgi:hypothetical protein